MSEYACPVWYFLILYLAKEVPAGAGGSLWGAGRIEDREKRSDMESDLEGGERSRK